MARLGDVVAISASSQELNDEKIWLLNLDMVEQQTGTIIAYNYVSKDELNSSIIQFDTNNVLYSKLRPNLNKVVLPSQRGFATSEMLPLRPDTRVLCKEYLTAYLRSDNFVTWATSKTAGAKMPRLGTKELLNKEIPLPSLNEQYHIAAVLDNISNLIALRKQQLGKLDELVKSRFIELFGNFIYDRNRWPICEVGTVADTIDPQPSHRTPPVFSDGIPYIGIAECNYNTRCIDFERARKVGQSVLQEHLQRYTINDGDFIIGKIGTIGKPFFVPAEQNYTLSANTVLIKPIKEQIVPQFLFTVFQSEYMDRIIDAEKKSTSQPAFGIQKVRRIEVPLPPLELQYQFAGFVEQTDKCRLTIRDGLDKLETMKKALMQEYFG